MKKISIFISIFLIALTVLSLTVFSSPKNDPILTLQAEEGELGGPASIYGNKVGYIGLNGGDVEGTVTFYNLDIPEDGEYVMQVHYYSGSDDRYFVFTVDGEEKRLDCPSTGGFDIVGTILMDIDLKKGCTLKIGTDWYGPDLDKIEIFKKGAFDFEDRIYSDPQNVVYKEGDYSLVFDTNNGVYSVSLNDDPIIKNAHSETMIDGTVISSDDFEKHEVSKDPSSGKITITHSIHSVFEGKLIQDFSFEDGYITTVVKVSSTNEITTNYVSVLSNYKNALVIENGTFLRIPFDNDMWEEPKFIFSEELGHTTTSYEVGAYFSTSDNTAIVCGSLSHDTWKTGVDINSEGGEIMGFNLYGGVSNGGTRDKFTHGSITGKEVSSPIMFIYVGDSWQNGLDLFGKANAKLTPAKASTSDVPFGFNSWGTLGTGVDYTSMIEISDYIEKYLLSIWQKNNSAVYVNLDSYWDYINHNDPSCDMSNEEALEAFVKNCKNNGQKAGIYFTPFAIWATDENDLKKLKMEGSDYTYYDAALRSSDGKKLYGTLDGGYALDPTHPGTVARIEHMINYFIDLGFEYLKLDFTTHGALEGQHYLKNVTTGMQAYNYGMEKIHTLCNGKMFVNLSISPVFPHQYADGRRVSCDAFASADNSRHVLSYVTSCFWQKSLYAYPDPDHLIVTGSDEGTARIRVTSGVISGTSFIIGDNLSAISEGSYDHKMIMNMYGNKDIVIVAKLGAMFVPYEYDYVDKCADTYIYSDGEYFYIAVFNFDDIEDISLPISQLTGKSVDELASAKELWSGDIYRVDKDGNLNFTVEGNDAAIIKISLTGEEPSVDPTPTDDEVVTPSVTPETTPTPPVSDAPVTSTSVPSTEDATKAPETSENNTNENGLILIIAVIAAIAVISVIVVVIIKKKQKNNR